MIRETVVTSRASDGSTHVAPMGLHEDGELLVLAPFRPSGTLTNILESKTAIVNYTDDVRVIAGCLTGRHSWPLTPADKVEGMRLSGALAHTELRLESHDEDPHRTWLRLRRVHEATHAPFRGFNRAQMSVLEAAILVSRLHMLPWDKVTQELEYLEIGLRKTAGDRELEAWGWLMAAVEQFRYNSEQGVRP